MSFKYKKVKLRACFLGQLCRHRFEIHVDKMYEAKKKKEVKT